MYMYAQPRPTWERVLVLGHVHVRPAKANIGESQSVSLQSKIETQSKSETQRKSETQSKSETQRKSETQARVKHRQE
ncbi:hypothetical protein DPMN_182205 [Dreissena polymorpha]|uniref:Uncharacterized protein n=1 Tax=Dreissena polymorpha TaxID=45954 RepID=A0A9D4I4D8_DREPO|nr:hypothetical protein DPMN_182205 [Dreissena polymorpha]